MPGEELHDVAQICLNGHVVNATPRDSLNSIKTSAAIVERRRSPPAPPADDRFEAPTWKAG